MEKLICNSRRGGAKTSSFARVVALALAGAAGTAFADTAINLANSLSTVEGVYTVEGTVVTLVKTNETYNLSGKGSWSVVLGADAFLNLNAVTLTPASGAAIDLNGHRADIALTGANTLTGASGSAGLQVNEGSTLTLSGYGNTQTLTVQGNGGGASLGAAAYKNAGSITVNGGTVTANAPNYITNAKRGAAIGGGYCGSGGKITINGGTVTATGGTHASGIGGGTVFDSSVQFVSAGEITVNGGTVTASGGKDGGPAIGTGHGAGAQDTTSRNGGTVTINGGTLNLTSGDGDTFSTIGGGKNTGTSLDVTIDAAATVTMNARANNTHQFGNRYANVDQGTLTFTNRRGLSNRSFLVLTGNDQTDYLSTRTGFVTAALGAGFAAGDVSCVQYPGKVRYWATRTAKTPPSGYDAHIDLDDLAVGDHGAYAVLANGTVEIAANKKVIVTGTGYVENNQDTTLRMMGAFDVTLSNAKIRGVTAGIDVNGQTGTLRLAEGTDNWLYAAYLSDYAAISLEDAASRLTLDGSGSLTIYANGKGSAAIGGGNGKSMLGTFIMNGGTLTARPGTKVADGQVCAVIGGGYCGSGGTVVVNGGTLDARHDWWGAAIGAGSTHGSTTAKVSAGHITINGGTVTAVGGKDGGAAIGCGHCNDGSDNFTGGTLVINGGKVNAIGCPQGSATSAETAIIGGGKNATAGMDVTIDVAATVVMSGQSDLTVAFGARRSASGAQGTLTITNQFDTTGFRRFLVYSAKEISANPVVPVIEPAIAGRVTLHRNVPASADGEAGAYFLDLPNDADYLYVDSPATNQSAYTVNGSIIELNGTKSVIVKGSANNAYALKVTGDFTGGNELVFADDGRLSPSADIPPLDLNGHALTVRVADGYTYQLYNNGNNAGIRVDENATLTIKGKGLADDRATAGKLIVTGRGKSAGIGGNIEERCGTVIIEGGDTVVAATGGSGTAGAGIGGGYGADGPVLFEMRDGWLQVGYYGNGSYNHGCGIGAGNSYNCPAGTVLDAGHIVFKGGYTSVCGARDGGAAIGGGHSSTGNSSGGGLIEFLGGTVYAKGPQKDSDSAVIGGGKQGGYGPEVVLDVAATLVVQKGNTTSAWGIGGNGVIAAGHEGSLVITNSTGVAESRVFFISEFGDELAGANESGLAVASLLADGTAFSTSLSGATAMSVFNPEATKIDLSTASGDGAFYSVSGNAVTVKAAAAGKTLSVIGSGKSLVCAADCTLILDGATLTGFDAGANDVTLVLVGASTSTGASGKAGVTVREGGTLTVKTVDGDDAAGSLVASGAGGGAGIGGDFNMGMAGNVVIDNGTVTAHGSMKTDGQAGAGIGAGGLGSCGTITINGGVVTADCGSGTHCAAIGGGANATYAQIPQVGKITINGGTVTATGSRSGGAAIGSGHEAADDQTPSIEIEINGGTVVAKTSGANNSKGTDFTGAVIGGGRKCRDVKVTISSVATVTTSYVNPQTVSSGSVYNDIGTSVPNVAAQVKFVGVPGTEGRVFLTTSYLDIFDTPQAALTADSPRKAHFSVAPNGNGRKYAYDPVDLVWTGAGDGSTFSDPGNWEGTLNAVDENGAVAFEAGGTLVNDVGEIAVTRLRHAPGAGAVTLTGRPIVSTGDLTLDGDGITLGTTYVDGTLAVTNGAQVRGGTILIRQFAFPSSANAPLPIATGARVVVESYAGGHYLDAVNGEVCFPNLPSFYVSGNSYVQFGGTGTFRFDQGLDLAYLTGSCNWKGSATFMLGGDIAGDMHYFHCIYDTVIWKPIANDVRVEDYVSLEGTLDVDTDDASGVARTFTLVRGLSSRNADNANRVLNVKGSGTVKVARAVPLRGEVNNMKAFNQTVNVTDTATFEFLPGASWDGSGAISVGAGSTLALDAGTAPFVKSATFAADSAVTVRGMVANTYAAPYLTATTLTGKPKSLTVNGKVYTARVRDGGLYAAPRGLVVFIR